MQTNGAKKSKIRTAGLFALKKHRGQIRKTSGKAYISHPISVTKLLRDYGNKYTKELAQTAQGEALLKNKEWIFRAAFLHDTLESTHTTYSQLARKFGKKTAGLVKELSNDKQVMQKMGSATYLTNLMKHMSSEALVIKLADRLHWVIDMERTKQAPPKWQIEGVKETKTIIQGIKSRIEQETILHKALFSEIERIISTL